MEEQENEGTSDKETEEGSEQNSNNDQDSDVSFQEEADEIDATEKKRRRMDRSHQKEHQRGRRIFGKTKIPCCIVTHRRLKWRMARRIDSLPEQRWTKRVFDWHLGLNTSNRTRRQFGRPKRRWEDDLNEFMKTEEGQEKAKYDFMNNNSWMRKYRTTKNVKKTKKSSQRYGSALFEPKSFNCVSSVLPPNHSPLDVFFVKKPCCAATCDAFVGLGVTSLSILKMNFMSSHRYTEGVTDDTQIQKTIDSIRQHRWTTAESDEHGSTRLLQVPDTEGCRVHKGLERVAKHHEQECARLPPVQGSEGYRVHRGFDGVAKHHEQDCAHLPPVQRSEGCRIHGGLERVAAGQGSRNLNAHLWVDESGSRYSSVSSSSMFRTMARSPCAGTRLRHSDHRYRNLYAHLCVDETDGHNVGEVKSWWDRFELWQCEWFAREFTNSVLFTFFFMSVRVITCRFLSCYRYWLHTLPHVQDSISLTDSCWGHDLPVRVCRARLTFRGDLIRMSRCHYHCHWLSVTTRSTKQTAEVNGWLSRLLITVLLHWTRCTRKYRGNK